MTHFDTAWRIVVIEVEEIEEIEEKILHGFEDSRGLYQVRVPPS